MKKMIRLSLLLNIVVLIPVCGGLLSDAFWVTDVYGTATTARGILLSIYGAILFLSAFLLFRHDVLLVAPLLFIQVIYKLTTPFTVGSFTNPVVISNILIAGVHMVTLSLIVRHVRRTTEMPRAAE